MLRVGTLGLSGIKERGSVGEGVMVDAILEPILEKNLLNSSATSVGSVIVPASVTISEMGLWTHLPVVASFRISQVHLGLLRNIRRLEA
jgi:hypothetical protein